MTLLAVVLAACSGGGGGAQVEPMLVRPFSGLATQSMLVFPVHYLRMGDSIGWSARVGSSRVFLAAFDSTLESVIRERSPATQWLFAPELRRAAQRNVGYLTDPHGLAAQTLRPPQRPPRDQIGDPLISQLRAWISLGSSRVAMLPVEIRFEGRSDSAQAVLRLALIDARLAQLSWMADIRSDFVTAPGPEMIRSLARQVADLALPP